MANGINKVILIGVVGSTPDMRALPTGSTVTSITVATNERWKDKDTGQIQERVEWHKVVLYNRLSEVATKFLKKGVKVYIEGSLHTRKWQDKSGRDQTVTEIIAYDMQMLCGKEKINEIRF